MNRLHSPVLPLLARRLMYDVNAIAELATASDRRAVFRRSDFVLVEHGLPSAPCTTCGDDHGPVYTLGCSHPAAFLASQVPTGRTTRPVSGDGAVPVTLPCGVVGIHGHDEPCIVWVD